MRILLQIQFCSFHYTYSIYLGPNRGSSSKSWGYKTVQCFYPWYNLETLLIKNEFQIATLLIKKEYQIVFVELKRDVMHSLLLWLIQIARKSIGIDKIKFKRAYIKVRKNSKDRRWKSYVIYDSHREFLTSFQS